MSNSEHLLAVIDPNEAGEVSLDIATDHVNRGGTATVVVLLDEQTRDDLRRFADAEGLHLHTGQAIALDRLVDSYTARVGGDTTTIVAESADSARELLEVAAASRATSMVIPQHVAARRSLRRLVSDTTVPLLIAPAA